MIDTAIIKTASSLALSLYGHPSAVAVDWAKRVDEPICWGLVKIGGIWYLVFRGSVTRNDWEHDFEALPMWVEELQSHVHPGFHDGIKDIVGQASAMIGSDDYVVAGHSLGAGRAAIAAGYTIMSLHRPIARVTWGEPRPGFGDLARVLAEIPNYNFLNGSGADYDRVTDVPFTLPFAWYCAGAPHLFVDEPPTAEFNGMFAWHNFLLYNAAMNKLPDGEM